VFHNGLTKRRSQQPDRWWQEACFEIGALRSFAAVAGLIVRVFVISPEYEVNKTFDETGRAWFYGTAKHYGWRP
jgi:hypothetical protein